jgi:hypothetical protein
MKDDPPHAEKMMIQDYCVAGNIEESYRSPEGMRYKILGSN